MPEWIRHHWFNRYVKSTKTFGPFFMNEDAVFGPLSGLDFVVEDDTGYFENKDFSQLRNEHFYQWFARLFSMLSERSQSNETSDWIISWPLDTYTMTWGMTQDGRFVAEEVPGGKTVIVNDKQGAVNGPCTIIRVWGMYGGAVCPHGVDSTTAILDSEGEAIMPKILKDFVEKFGKEKGLEYMLDDSIADMEAAEAAHRKYLDADRDARFKQLETDNKKLTEDNAKLTANVEKLQADLKAATAKQ